MLRKHALTALALSCAVSLAQGREFGDWSAVPAGDGSGDAIAGTVIEGGSEVLVVRCYAKNQTCLHVLKTSSRCEDEARYPLLLNSTPGAYQIDATCLDGNQLVLAPFDKVRRSIVETNGMIGFAIPMESGAFRVLRFSTKGSAAAIEEAERLVRKTVRPQNRPGAITL